MNGGNKNWSEAVEKISLSSFTSETIKQWQRDRRKGSLKIDSTNRTANSIIRSGKALFKPALIEELGDLFDLPDPLPFRAFKIKEPRVKRYTSVLRAKFMTFKSLVFYYLYSRIFNAKSRSKSRIDRI